jgi:hypothetical protein
MLTRGTAGGQQMKDLIVEEVRKHRMEHTQKHGGDLTAICANLHEIQKVSGHKVVRLAPNKIERTSHSTGSRTSPKKLASR